MGQEIKIEKELERTELDDNTLQAHISRCADGRWIDRVDLSYSQ
jgi:hypothetical protein